MPSPSSAHSSPLTNLRHITSNIPLIAPAKDSNKERERKVSGRVSQQHQLQTGSLTAGPTRLGSKSPNSIPSSPTSVHSSSSAIFERDIEPITSPSPPYPHLPPNPHRTPRSKTTEQLDQSVPSVLDSAAAILASPQGSLEDDRISVVAPATGLFAGSTGSRSGVASPIGSFRSRSPSPTTVNQRRTSLLLNIPSPSLQTHVPLATSPPKGNILIQTLPAPNVAHHPNISTPSIVTPTSTYYTVTSSNESSPTTTTMEHPPSCLPTSISPSQSQSPASPRAIPLTLSHPPSPIASSSSTIGMSTSNADKRLSFMSYSDLLACTPASLQPLSSLTSSASSDPPPHIPSVSGITQSSPAAQAHGSHSPSHSPSLFRVGGVIEGRVGDSLRDSGAFDDIGGEWEREGMGGGLEERLEAFLEIPGAYLTPPVKA